MDKLSLMSFNVRGLRDQNKRLQIYKFLKEKGYDIILLQETHSTIQDTQYWSTQWSGKMYFSHGKNNSKGTAILINRKTKIQVKSISSDDEGRLLEMDIDFEGIHIKILNLYAPNGDEPKFFNDLADKIESSKCENIIVAGDYNLVLDLEKDKKGGNKITHSNSADVVKKMMYQFNLVDVWRYFNKDKEQFTWTKLNPDIIMVRLDFFLITSTLLKNVISTDIIPSFKSDHDIPTLVVQKANSERGPGFWHFNNTLLKDNEYCKQVVECINETKSKSFESIQSKWDIIKLELRGMTVKYSSRKKKSRENTLKAIERKISHAYNELMQENQESNSPFSRENTKIHVQKLKQDREKIIQYKLQSSMIRSRRSWLEFGEKNSKLFFNLEKYNYSKKNRYQLQDKNGVVQYENSKILEIQKSYYEDLYTTRKTIIDESYLESLNLPQVTQEENELLCSEISEREIKKALWDMPANKVTGSEGFPPEFYRRFYDDIKRILYLVIVDATKNGFTKNISRGIISLMEKPQKNLLKIESWRPLSLLNTEFKLLSKILVKRLNTVLPRIIHSDQSGFLKGRGVSDNIMDLLSAIEYCNEKKIATLLINFDFYKAFDQVEWNVLFTVMKKFGFAEGYINMIRALYTGIESCTINRGFTSEYISITQGLRQGDPLSSSLFLLLVEVLGEKIRNNTRIKGININNKFHKAHAQYADDLWALILDNEENFKEIMQTVDLFCKNTGLKINYNKTEVVRFGSLRDNDPKYYSEKPLQWSTGTKVLGIDVHTNKDIMLTKNFNVLLDKMQKVLNVWKARSLTLIGRTQVINTLVVSLATQKLTCLPSPPKTFFQKAKEIIINFMWKGKKPKIAYNKLVQEISDGGIKLVDLPTKEASLKMSWVKKSLIDLKDTLWKRVAKYFISIKLPEVWSVNIKSNDVKKIIKRESMWKDILCHWSTLHYNDPENANDVLIQKLCYNSHIRVNGNVIKQNMLNNVSICQIQDIYNCDENRFSTHHELCRDRGYTGTFLHLNSIISAIPKEWTRKLKRYFGKKNATVDLLEPKTMYDWMENSQKGPKLTYGPFLKKNCPTKDDALDKWNKEFEITQTPEQWKKVRENGHYISISTKLRDFQYRVISHRLTTNVLRNKWDESISKTCTFCEMEDETISHILYYCKKVVKCWRALERWLNYFFDIKIRLDLKTVIQNDAKVSHHSLFVNTCILVMKQYIYATKCQKGILSFNVFAKKIHELYLDEKFIAENNNKVHKNNKKWGIYKLIL